MHNVECYKEFESNIDVYYVFNFNLCTYTFTSYKVKGVTDRKMSRDVDGK